MTDLSSIVGKYLALWNETDDPARRRAIDEVFTDDGTYTDPLATVTGRDAIDQLVKGAQDAYAGLRFQPLGEVDAHHNIVRFRWALVPDGGSESVAEGFDVAVVEDGRIKSVFGFLDKVPAST